MDTILSNLGTLLNNVKNLTLPGLIAALGFAILLWPPQPIDVVTDARLNPAFNPWPTARADLISLANREFGPVCETRFGSGPNNELVSPGKSDSQSGEAAAKTDTSGTDTLKSDKSAQANQSVSKPSPPAGRERVLRHPESLPERKPFAVANQFDLERIARQLQDCSDKEKALSGVEDSLIADINAEIEVRKKERDDLQTAYIGYERTNNPLKAEFQNKLASKEHDIALKQRDIREQQQLKRERDRRSTELTRLSKEVSDRLAEPGRLRPLQKFDDFLNSLSSHVIAFLALALGWSLLFEPINRAVFGFAYESSFDDQLDYARDDRKPLFVYPRKKPSPSNLWILPVAVGLVGVVLLARLAGSPAVTSALCALSPVQDCPVADRPAQMLLWLLACLTATLGGVGLAILFTGWRGGKKWDEHEGTLAEGAGATSGKTGEAKADDDRDKAQLADRALRMQVADASKTTEDAKTEERKKQEEKATLTCLDKLRKDWEKIKQPEFAIGQGLLTRAEYNGIRDDSYAQSLISIGLVLPIMFLTFAIVVTPQLGLGVAWWSKSLLWLFLVAAETALIMVGADRRHKFDMEVESLIASRFLKNCKATAKPTEPATPPPSVIDLIRSELKKAKITQHPDLTIEPDDSKTS
jgi:hypothetical protein